MTNLNHIETPKETPVCETVFNLMKELELCAPSTFDNLGKFNNAWKDPNSKEKLSTPDIFQKKNAKSATEVVEC